MKGSKGPSAVTLQARLPTSETISIEAVASEEMKKVKERIASMGGLDVDSFTLTFDGEVVVAAADDGGGQLVGDLPFEDGSMLEVVVSKRQAALLKLSEMGIEVKRDDILDSIYEKDIETDEEICEVMNLLLDAGVSGGMEKALHVAAEHNLPSCVEVLLIRTSVNVNSEICFRTYWKNPCTALHRTTSEEVAAVLLRHNADVNARDGDGFPIIHGACEEHPGSTLSVLLKHNADVNARDRDGMTALHGHNVHPSAVHLLLEHKADIEAKDNEGRTPLFLTKKKLEAVEALLEHNADMKARDNRGNTCLHHAVLRFWIEVLPVLLRHNADVAARNDEGKTALDLVPSDDSDKAKAMRYLLEDPSLAHDLELFESGRELSDVSRLPAVQLISKVRHP